MQTINHSHTILETSDLSFAYTSELVVSGINLQIHKGDYLGIVGPNGGGKSTLLKLMLGILKPQSGDVKIFGIELKNFKEWYKIGYVPQKTYFENSLPLTVEELVMMGRYGKLGLFHSPGKVDKEKTHAALKHVEMLEYKNRQINDLSGGQQQRVLIARALSSEPEIVFLDEPTVGVDIATQKQFYTLLRKLNRELSLTLILVSHELDVVAHEATELAYINRTLEYYGEPEEFLKGEYFHSLIGKGGLHHL